MDRSNQLDTALKTLYEREEAYGKSLKKHAKAKHDYEIKRAQEELKADGTQIEKRALGIVNSSKDYLAYLNAEADLRFIRAKLEDCREAIGVRRSQYSGEVRTHEATKYITE